MRSIQRFIRNSKAYLITHKKTALPIIIGTLIVVAGLTTVMIKNSNSKKEELVTNPSTTPTPTKKPSKTPTPTITPTPKVTIKITYTPTPTVKPTATTPSPTSGPTLTPTPKKDTQPPSYGVIAPPSNQTITDSRFCFKIIDFHDNVSPTNEIYFKFWFDGQETDWVQNPEKCYDLNNGYHDAQIKVKDKAENYSNTSVQFTVQKPTATATPNPSPTNTPQPTSAPTPTI